MFTFVFNYHCYIMSFECNCYWFYHTTILLKLGISLLFCLGDFATSPIGSLFVGAGAILANMSELRCHLVL